MFTLSPVSADQIAKLKTALASHGTVVETLTPSTSPGLYMIRGHGVVAKAQFDGGAQSLAVTIEKRPFFESESSIERGLRAELAALGVVAAAPAVPVGNAPAAV